MSDENMRTNMPQWQALEAHHSRIKDQEISKIFENDTNRFCNFSVTFDDFLIDYSKTNITEETRILLEDLAKACNVEEWRDKMFAGEPINNSEERAVLHTALRGSINSNVTINNENVSDFVESTRERVKSLCTKIRSDNIFKDIVCIGIGGSELGLHTAYEGLKPFCDGPQLHFVSNIDGAHITQTLKGLSPSTTLFVVISKTFKSLETLQNAHTAKTWIEDNNIEDISAHFIAITTNDQAARTFGVCNEYILPLRDWIGGRYSVWSAIGLPLALACGYINFEKFLSGAHAMDDNFKNAPFKNNLPMILAMVGIWHRSFCDYDALAIMPYAQNLQQFPRYIQQLDMESNGKTIDRDGQRIEYKTSPVVFGEPGTDSQHAFFQLLHQGTPVIPCDFIVILKPEHTHQAHHTHLLANAIAQSEALMNGSTSNAPAYKTFDGNRPSTTIAMKRLTPYNLGMLMALYEHKIFVQGVIWNLNSFDQWGVELGKNIAKDIFKTLQNETCKKDDTKSFLNYVSKNL